MVPISSLSGLVELEPGVLRLIEIPPARAGGGRGFITSSFLKQTSRLESDNFRIAVLDLESIALFRRSDMDFDLEMPPPEGVIDPLVRGLDVIAVGTPFSISRVLRTIERTPGYQKVERFTLSPDSFEQEKQ
jgi:predicted transcriptional regulator